jgi:hypothetical protein
MLATERTAAGRFAPGRSGNPAGRPPGSRNRSTLALEDALAARAEELVDALIRSASEGKPAALRICFDRGAPLRKGRPVRLALPPVACHGDVVAAAAAVVAQMADGELTPSEARDVLEVLQAFARVASPARRGEAPSADDTNQQPPEPAETCGSPESAAGAADEKAEAVNTVAASTATADPPPAAAAASRQPRAPGESCKSSESESEAADQIVGAVDPAPAVAAEAPAPPRTPADACIRPVTRFGSNASRHMPTRSQTSRRRSRWRPRSTQTLPAWRCSPVSVGACCPIARQRSLIRIKDERARGLRRRTAVMVGFI